MSLDTVKTAVVNKLGVMQSLKQVFPWETSNSPGAFPYATVTLRQGDGKFADTFRNFRKHGFTIRVYQEQSKVGQGPQNAEEISKNVIDELEKALDMDTTLSGVVKYVMPIRWRAGYVDREFDTRILTIELDAMELVSSK